MAETLDSIKKENKKSKPKEIKKPSFWTKEEDKILMDKAQEFNYKNWNAIADFIPGRTSIQCSARYRRIRPGLIKGAWDKEEDTKLLALYKKYGKNWAAISKEMPQRTGKQIRDRFLNSLDTKFSRGKFTEEEDQAIIKYFKIYGNSWAKIAKKLKTRTGDMVKNRFYSSLKKTILKNKNFLRRKRLSSSPNIIKNKINEDKNVEAKKNKFSSPFRNHQSNIGNIGNKINEEEEIEINSIKEPNFENFEDKIQAKKEINISYNNPNSYQKESEEKNQNHIIIKNDSSEDSIDYSDKFNKILTDNCENENRLKNNMNNNTYFNFEDNKKNEIINEPEFNDNINYNYNSDFFAAFGNNVNKNNFYTLYYRDEIDERLDKYKNCPKLELDYKQKLREQLGIIFNFFSFFIFLGTFCFHY